MIQKINNSMHKILFEKYRASIDIHNVKIINEIIFNRPVRITSIFKDYLVQDEVAEFIKRYYTIKEVPQRMEKLVEFFNSYFKVFPNYIQLSEKSYLYKNIERKQRVIDEKQYIIAKNKRKVNESSRLRLNLFTPSYYNDISEFRQHFTGRKQSSPAPLSFSYQPCPSPPSLPILSQNILKNKKVNESSIQKDPKNSIER